jgi:Fe-S oxidoreductase
MAQSVSNYTTLSSLAQIRKLMVDNALVRDIGRRKLQLALDTGARTIVSACQQCKRTIAATAKAEKTGLRVLDITEFVGQAVENGIVDL